MWSSVPVSGHALRVPGSSAVPTTAGYLKSPKPIFECHCVQAGDHRTRPFTPNQAAILCVVMAGKLATSLVKAYGRNSPLFHASSFLCFTKSLSGKACIRVSLVVNEL